MFCWSPPWYERSFLPPSTQLLQEVALLDDVMPLGPLCLFLLFLLRVLLDIAFFVLAYTTSPNNKKLINF